VGGGWLTRAPYCKLTREEAEVSARKGAQASLK
jgi:hypothetical protein